MTTILTLQPSITTMSRVTLFDFIKAVRTRRHTPITPIKSKAKAMKRVPKTKDPRILAKSLTRADQLELKRLLLESMK